MVSRANKPASGRRVPIGGGVDAFIPDPLPPRVEWTPTLVRVLSEADRLLSRLAGEAGRLPKPEILLRPLLSREAVLSSRIEGTRTGLEELLAAEAGAAQPADEADWREVSNYLRALDHGLKRRREIPLSLRLVRELHEHLVRGVRGSTGAPGEFRRVQNWIGPPGARSAADASYVPPPPDALAGCLNAWEKFLHHRSLPPLVHIALAHYQFEAIHPFLDGNGRVGRLVIILLLLDHDLLRTPFLPLSAYFEATRPDYYATLRAVSEAADWDGWLRYFLTGVALISEDTLSRAQRIHGLLERWRAEAEEARSNVPARLVDQLGRNPYCTIRGVARRLRVAFTTAQRAVEFFERAGILTQVGERLRDRVYCARSLLAILNEPVRLRRRGRRDATEPTKHR